MGADPTRGANRGLSERDAEMLAGRVLAALDAGASLAPLTDDRPDLTVDDAYLISAAATRARVARGERPVGWKIGFTNRTLWDTYGVRAPIWGPMYDSTVAAVPDAGGAARASLAGLSQPRIEPEIVFRMAAPAAPGMDEQELLSRIDAVGLAFEIVQSPFPDWRFRAADTVAALGLHGRLRHGALVAVAQHERARWQALLTEFTLVLSCDGVEIDRGRAADVLGGPLTALRHFVAQLDGRPFGRGVEAGDLVTTGTVTKACPVLPGQRWTSAVTGLPLASLTLALDPQPDA